MTDIPQRERDRIGRTLGRSQQRVSRPPALLHLSAVPSRRSLHYDSRRDQVFHRPRAQLAVAAAVPGAWYLCSKLNTIQLRPSVYEGE